MFIIIAQINKYKNIQFKFEQQTQILIMSLDKYITKLQSNQLLTELQVQHLTQHAVQVLFIQPNVINVQGQHYVIGDIHGQFYDLLHMFKTVMQDIGSKRCVFLGDYVDRGYHSIETICYLLAYKCKYPDKIILLRGNHQTASLSKIYGFYDEVIKKYGNIKVWKMIIEAFKYLPIATVVQDSILCIHGGLSPEIGQIKQISQLSRIGQVPQSGPICDLLWSDPQPSITQWKISNRGAGYFFSHDITKQFLYLNDIKTIARAHQLVDQGYIYNFGDQSLVTIWSAPNYCYRCGNQASVMRISQHGEKQFKKFQFSSQTQKNKVHYDNILPYFL